jgi:hypothetical protein
MRSSQRSDSASDQSKGRIFDPLSASVGYKKGELELIFIANLALETAIKVHFSREEKL